MGGGVSMGGAVSVGGGVSVDGTVLDGDVTIGGVAPKASPEHSDVDPISSPRWPNRYQLKVS